jgi:tetratricopeptide (TPR) repeat protein
MMMRRVSAGALLCLVAVSLRADSPAADLAAHGHWKRLKAQVEPRAAANANDAEAQWLLSRVRAAYRDFDGALAPAEKAVALDRRNADYQWQLAQVVGELASDASVFKQMGLARRYKREVEAALAINPKHTEALTGLMEFHTRAPGIVGGDKKKAQEIVEQIMAINKVDGCIAKVRLLGRQSPVPMAEIEQAWVQAVQADPNRYEPHLNLANIYAGGTSPRWELAEKEALAARHLDADRVNPYGLLASIYAAQEKWTELEAILTEAEKRIPDNLSPYLRTAGTLTNTGKDLARAERYARKYLSQEPEPNASSHAVAHWRLGLVLEKQGRKADAIAELQTATRLDPKFEPAQKDLKRLRA